MSDTEKIDIRSDNYFAAFPHWVLDMKLSSTAVHLYIALLSFANWETKRGKPSRQTLAEMMSCSIRTVDRAKDELVNGGLLTYTRRRHASNYYTVITANPRQDKNDISESRQDKFVSSKPLRQDKNDTLTIINTNYNKDGDAIHDLMKIYFDNFSGTLQPARGQTAGQLQSALQQIPYEQLLPAVKQVAIEGQIISRNTLIQVLRRVKSEPTPMPPRFSEADRPKGIPMPDYLKDLVKRIP